MKLATLRDLLVILCAVYFAIASYGIRSTDKRIDELERTILRDQIIILNHDRILKGG